MGCPADDGPGAFEDDHLHVLRRRAQEERMTMTRSPTVVLVHGAWCGDWVYWKLGPCLEARGLRWVGADLPSCRATDTSVGPLDDIAAVRELVRSIDGPVVVAGKSYGGTVISGATAGCAHVEHLVYLAAAMPAPDEPFQQTTVAAMTPELAQGLRFLDDGRVAMDAEIGAACAFGQATDEDRDVWRRSGRPMSLGRDPSVHLDRVGWAEIPSTYIVCSEDRAIRPSAQRDWARQATQVVERPWDHSPGVSHPVEVAELLAAIAGAI
jgi:pimeloyl-ACP methyl ester carboxylesterase